METESFLSDSVRQRFINNPPSYDPLYDDCFGSDLLIDWNHVNDSLGDIANHGWKDDETTAETENEFYSDKTLKLWYLINSAGKIWREARADVTASIVKRIEWINREPDELTRLSGGCHCEANALEVILKLTSFLDRALCDVYLVKTSPAPFLLRDLLHSFELESVIGTVPVRLLNITMGHVLGLNLRNIAWHGFLSEGHFSSNLVPFLLLVAATIGRDLTSAIISHRPYQETHIEQVSLLDDFFSELPAAIKNKREVIDRCPHVPLSQRLFWVHAFKLFDQGQYGDSLVVLLPLLEHSLRSIYREVNNCPDDVLKATTTEFYVIMDDILEVNVKGEVNGLINKLGANVFEALIDIFTAQKGPRIRDRISHGEIRLGDVAFKLASHIFGLALYIADVSGGKKLAIPIDIESKFHSRAILKRQLSESACSLKIWGELPTELSFHWDTREIEGIVFSPGYSVTQLVDDSIKTVNSTRVDTLTRQTTADDCLLTNIAVNVHRVSQTARDNLTNRTLRYKNKQMRSRARTNYLLMLDVLPVLRATLALLVNALAQMFAARLSMDSNQQKDLKKFLKFTENAITMCSAEKNRWFEIKKSCMELINLIRSCPILNLIKKTERSFCLENKTP